HRNRKFRSVTLSNLFNQPPGRVLPAQFCQQGDVHPNCIGKTMLLLAFARISGARAYLITPLETTQEYYDRRAGFLVRALFSIATDSGLPMDETFADLNRQASDVANSPLGGSHGSVILELADGGWLVADPNFNVCRRSPPWWKLDDKLKS